MVGLPQLRISPLHSDLLRAVGGLKPSGDGGPRLRSSPSQLGSGARLGSSEAEEGGRARAFADEVCDGLEGKTWYSGGAADLCVGLLSFPNNNPKPHYPATNCLQLVILFFILLVICASSLSLQAADLYFCCCTV